MTEPCHPDVFLRELVLQGDPDSYRVTLAVCDAPGQGLDLMGGGFLHPEELDHYQGLQSERRRQSYLLGKYVAKRAVSGFIGDENLTSIRIQTGIFHQPVVVHPIARNLQTSVTHCDDLGAAVAFPETVPIGLDVERIRFQRQDVMERVMTPRELDLVTKLPYAQATTLTLLWTLKESLSKALKTGLLTPFQVYEVAKVEASGRVFKSEFCNFNQFRSLSFIYRDFVFTVTYPGRLELSMQAIRKLVEELNLAAFKRP